MKVYTRISYLYFWMHPAFTGAVGGRILCVISGVHLKDRVDVVSRVGSLPEVLGRNLDIYDDPLDRLSTYSIPQTCVLLFSSQHPGDPPRCLRCIVAIAHYPRMFAIKAPRISVINAITR